MALLYGVVAVQSAFFAVGNPARASIIPRLVGIDLLPAANALGTLAWSIGFTLGPLLGGVVIAATRRGHRGVRRRRRRLHVRRLRDVAAAVRSGPRGTRPTRAGWAAVKDGITFLRGKKNLQMSFYVDMAAMVFGMPRALFPAIARRRCIPTTCGWRPRRSGCSPPRRRSAPR